MRSPTSRTCATSISRCRPISSKRGRTDWMGDEMEVLTSPETYRDEPDEPGSG